MVALCPSHRPGRGQPDGRPQLNGKVVGALTGIRAARHEVVVLADDDVRHTRESITAIAAALEDADLVRPVNVFDAWPWQARWDGARTLLNVALATDWPGTFGLRRSTVLGCGGWSADVLFENLELWRTVVAAGGRTVGLADVAVPRRPPSVGQFWSQRVRHAYDDLAQPGRLMLELAILPLTALAARRGVRHAAVLWAGVVILAARGRYRLGPDRVPWTVPLGPPLWALERGVCVWLALGSRLVRWGGVPRTSSPDRGPLHARAATAHRQPVTRSRPVHDVDRRHTGLRMSSAWTPLRWVPGGQQQRPVKQAAGRTPMTRPRGLRRGCIDACPHGQACRHPGHT